MLPFQYKIEDINLDKNFYYPRREEYKFTKSDLLDYFGFLNDKSILETPQYWAGNFFIKKNDTSIKFITEWLNVFYERFDLVDDTPSKIKNHKDFIENRHDQSIFSMLSKTMGSVFIQNETEFRKRPNSQYDFPFLSVRSYGHGPKDYLRYYTNPNKFTKSTIYFE